MKTNSKAIYFAAVFDDACMILQEITSTARNYGNCLTDNIYRTDYTTRNGIVKRLCSAHHHCINCSACEGPVGAVDSERAAALAKIVNENVGALPAPIREALRKIESYDAETDGAFDFDSVTQAADNVAKTADKDIDYTYKARLATAAMNVYAGICVPDDLDPADAYIGLRLAAIKLQEAINASTAELALAACACDITPSWRVCADLDAKLSAMISETQKARASLYGFTGVDYRETETICFDGDLEITQVINIINTAANTAAKSESTKTQLIKLRFDVCHLPDIDLEQVRERLYKALTALRKLAALCNATPEQQEPGIGDICSSGIVGNAMKE